MFPQIHTLMTYALQSFEKGNLEESERILTLILNKNSRNFDALHLKGIVLGVKNRHKEAQQHFKKALKINPNNVLLNFNYAKSLTDSGDNYRALTYHLAAIKLNPQNHECWINYGISLDNLKNYKEALTAYDTAISINSQQPLAWLNRAKTLEELKDFNEALFSYEKLLELEPNFFEAWFNIGCILHTLKKYDQAIFYYEKALELEATFAEAWSNRGNTLNALTRYNEALSSCNKAININPNLFEAWSNKGNALKELKEYDQALTCYDKAISLEPKFFEGWYNRGTLLAATGRHHEADFNYREAINIHPGFDVLNSNFVFNLNYMHNVKPEQIANEAAKYGLRVSSRAHPKFSSWHVDSDNSRLRIGFVSGDLKKHPVGYFILGLLENLNLNKFEVYFFPTQSKSDEITKSIRTYSKEWVPIYNQSDYDAASCIHSKGINILIDLSGHTATNRLPVFSYKPAPVQITWLGLPVTTGVPEIDYILGDCYSLLDEYKNQFTEKLWRLPESYLCLKILDEHFDIRKIHKKNDHQIVFGSFNNVSKINDVVIDAWSRILTLRSNSILLLKSNQLNDPWMKVKVKNSFASKGIDLRRIQVIDATESYSDHLTTYNKVDIALDTFPYPGVTTSLESLFMGVPVLSLKGDRFLSSTATSIAVNAGLSEWVAEDVDDYVRKAINFSSNPQKLSELRLNLQKNVLASPLFNTSLFSEKFGDALFAMWHEKSQSL